MQEKTISKEEQHRINCERFKKTPQERENLKKLKSEWKKNNLKK